MLEIGDGIDKLQSLFLGKDKGKLGTILHPRHFVIAPSLFEDINSEEPDGRRMSVDAVIGEFPDLLEMEEIGTDMFVGSL